MIFACLVALTRPTNLVLQHLKTEHFNMLDITEANWKIFKQIKERALEKYYQQCLNEYVDIAARADLTLRERYGLHYQTVHDRDKNLADMFNGLSRSRAFYQLVQIRREGIADPELIAQLSEEYQRSTDPKNFEY